MNLDKHTLTHKKYVRAIKALDELKEQLHGLPWRELEKPYQDGWILSPTLRRDYNHVNRPVVFGLVQRYGIPFVTKSPKVVSQVRKKPAMNDARKIVFHKKWLEYMDGLTIKSLDRRQYEALSDQHRRFFTLTDHVRTPRGWEPKYELDIRDHYIVIRVEKRIITHIQDIDPILLQQEAALESILEPYWRTKGDGYSWIHRHENRQERRQTHVELSQHEYEKQSQESMQ